MHILMPQEWTLMLAKEKKEVNRILLKVWMDRVDFI